MLPGPESRYREGDSLRVLVNNALSVPTTVHWHGMIVPNYMDGVPDLTQLPIEPKGSVLYEYPLRQTGTYWYHSHYQFQEQTGLSGPLNSSKPAASHTRTTTTWSCLCSTGSTNRPREYHRSSAASNPPPLR